MRLLLLFLGTIAAVLALLMAVTWWIDPLGQFYDPRVLRTAMAEPEPCLISDDLIGGGSWLAFKEDVYRNVPARTIVVGTSRVLKMGASPDEREFANLGMPGTGAETLAPLFRRLRDERPAPLTVYIGVEIFWFNASWRSSVTFGSRPLADASYLLARQSVTTSLERLAHDPAFAWHRWRRERVGGRCALDRGSRLRAGKIYAWETNGAVVYPWDLPIGLPPRLFVPASLERGYYANWHTFDRGRLRQLDAALALARSYGWRVVGFAPPATTRYTELLMSSAHLASRSREFAGLVPPVFRRHRFPFLDLRRAADVPCPEWAFYRDGWHPKQLCLETVRTRLQAVGG